MSDYSFYVTKEEAGQIIPYLELLEREGPKDQKPVASTLKRKLLGVRKADEDFPLRGEQVPLTGREARLLALVGSSLGLPDMSRP